jgi:antitoxin (DNA-binding transcriptional repressor) of toxin-antitoxin stability system
MEQINIHEAKTHLSALVEKAYGGEPFIIAKAGRPMVTVRAYNAEAKPKRRIGFLAGQCDIPADFDRLCETEIAALFEGGAQ